MKNIYLSGPMTGLPEFNYPAFAKAAQELRDEGYQVYNPQEYPWDGPLDQFPIRAAFAEYCEFICEKADAIFMLPGWQNSKGAIVEKLLAERVGVEVVYL